MIEVTIRDSEVSSGEGLTGKKFTIALLSPKIGNLFLKFSNSEDYNKWFHLMNVLFLFFFIFYYYFSFILLIINLFYYLNFKILLCKEKITLYGNNFKFQNFIIFDIQIINSQQ